MVADGEIDRIALLQDFLPVESYAEFVDAPQPTGHAATDELQKSDGPPNFNHGSYIEVSRAYGEAAATVFRRHPQAYAAGVAKGVCIFFKPGSDYWSVGPNRAQINAWDRIYNAVVHGELGQPPLDEGCRIRWLGQGQVALWLPLLFIAALAGAIVIGLRRGELPQRAGAVFIAAAMGWVALSGNLFELGENHRFRWVTAPLMWLALALVADRLLRWRRHRRDLRSASEQMA